ATDDELRMFLHLASSYGLDPFARDVWFIKDKSGNPIIMTSRDGYIKIANSHAAYDGIEADVVYQGDKFRKIKDGVEHIYETKNRGNPVGAYAMVYRKDRSRPIYVYAPMSNYYRNSPVWRQYPHAMILKVAEAQALKRAFSISGLVTREELDEEPDVQPKTQKQTAQAITAEVINEKPQAATQAPNGQDLNEYKKNLYLEYLKLCGNDEATARNEMLKMTEGRGSAQWTVEDLKMLEQDIEFKREAIRQEVESAAD
ncbi:MAG: recombinase RecT, partial [Synergistaceae bacterium]|nr:recombinase RecT [Synergistaceae bacterium]